jgi:hypothetical protein
MSAHRTEPPASSPRPLLKELKAAVKKALRTTCEALDEHGVGKVSVELGLSATIGERWAKATVDHHLPVYALGDRQAVPRALLERLLATVYELRGEGPVLAASAESACAMTIARGGETASVLGRALANGRVDPDERVEARASLLAQKAQIDAALAALDRADAQGARS